MYFFILDTLLFLFFFFFFFNDTATTEIYTLSLHDALPISRHVRWNKFPQILRPRLWIQQSIAHEIDQLVKLHSRKDVRRGQKWINSSEHRRNGSGWAAQIGSNAGCCRIVTGRLSRGVQMETNGV